MHTRRRYQRGCLRREKRATGPSVWTFRYREGKTNRKVRIGTLEELPTKLAAMKACEFLRSTINRDTRSPKTFGELADHFVRQELPKKTPYYGEVCQGYLRTWISPAWGEYVLSDIKAVGVESWLCKLPLANGTKAKLRNLMHAIYVHGMRWEFTDRNPISLVRQSAKRERAPEVLTISDLRALLAELSEPWKTAVFVATVTGLRVSELLGLKWQDLDFAAEEIRLSRGVVRQRLGKMKTEASHKPLPLDSRLADTLLQWRAACPYNQDSDYIFASPYKHGTQPYWPTSGMENHVRPAAKRAGITTQVSWHTLRHTFGTLIKANGADVATTQALMRHANASITLDRYVQAVTPAKREAQSGIVAMLQSANVPMRSHGLTGLTVSV